MAAAVAPVPVSPRLMTIEEYLRMVYAPTYLPLDDLFARLD